jgi:hypothetical protein
METDAQQGPLLAQSLNFGSYVELLQAIETINFADPLPTNDSCSALRLPPELCKRVAAFFVIEKVDMVHVRVIDCSSTLCESIQLSNCLTDDENTWWLSDYRMPGGTGREYVEFRLVPPGQTLCRLTAVHIKTPPLPQGPFSVREFQVEAKKGRTWEIISQVFEVANETGFQRFQLHEPADVDIVRIVCLSSQISVFVVPGSKSSVGFQSVLFE